MEKRTYGGKTAGIREQLLRTVEKELEKAVRAAKSAGLTLEQLGEMAAAQWEEAKDE